MSSKNAGIGIIIAMTMPRTAKGAAISLRFPNREPFFATALGFNATTCDFGAAPRAGFCAETGAILGAAAIYRPSSAFHEPDQVEKITDYS
ncbi:MAG: hypothetical protein ABSF22_10470 [Bryobacteraceae bacterium]